MKARRLGATAVALALGLAPSSAAAVDLPLPAKVMLLKQNRKRGFEARLAKIVSRLRAGSQPVPSAGGAADPRIHGGTLRFCKLSSAGTVETWKEVVLQPGHWRLLGDPPGSKGFQYRGAGRRSIRDPCRTVLVTEKVIKAICQGPGAFQSPDPFSLPVGPAGVAWELTIGNFRYCAVASAATGAQIKRDDARRGVWKAIRAPRPVACPILATPTPVPTPTPTPPYGSASQAFLGARTGLLD